MRKAAAADKVKRFFGLCVLTAMAIAGGLTCDVTSGHAALRGMIVGVNVYPNLPKNQQLGGAVNDAVDIAATIRGLGAKDVTVLLDRQVTKEAFEKGWQQLVARSRAGDTIVFSFAGHGSQEAEADERGGERDRKNENFLLSGFSPKAPHNKERVVDDEINAWLRMADDKGINVIFIADSCHSGTMFRSVTTPVRYRSVPPIEISDDQVTLPSLEHAKAPPDSFRNVTFVAATVEDRQIPELQIEGKWRGALSYAFARALEKNGADENDDKTITQAELINYLLGKVQTLVEGQQEPQVLPIRAANRALLAREIVIEPKKAPANEDLLKVAVKNGPASLLNNVPDVVVVDDPAKADLVWDVTQATMEHVPGGRVAENVGQDTLHTVLSKWTTIKWLKTHARGLQAQFILRSGQQRYKRGDKISLSFKGAGLPFLTLFNLAPNGRVEFMLLDHETQKDWRSEKANWQFKLGKPPYGSEHLVAILTDQPLSDLHKRLKGMTTAASALPLRALISKTLEGREYEFAIQGIYTGEGN